MWKINQKDIIMEIELQQRHHNPNHLLRVVGKRLLQFPRVADQHLTGGALVFQARCLDAKTLLLAQVHKLPTVLLVHVFRILS